MYIMFTHSIVIQCNFAIILKTWYEDLYLREPSSSLYLYFDTGAHDLYNNIPKTSWQFIWDKQHS